MSERRQLVKIGDSASGIKNLDKGSPQGGILSPLLFLLYVSDMELWTSAAIYSFADDTSLYLPGNTMEYLAWELERGAKNVLAFMAANDLLVNPDKTEYMVLGTW